MKVVLLNLCAAVAISPSLSTMSYTTPMASTAIPTNRSPYENLNTDLYKSEPANLSVQPDVSGFSGQYYPFPFTRKFSDVGSPSGPFKTTDTYKTKPVITPSNPGF